MTKIYKSLEWLVNYAVVSMATLLIIACMCQTDDCLKSSCSCFYAIAKTHHTPWPTPRPCVLLVSSYNFSEDFQLNPPHPLHKSFLIYSPHAIRDGGASPAASLRSRCWSTKILVFLFVFFSFFFLSFHLLISALWWQQIKISLFLVSTSFGALQQIKQGKKVGLIKLELLSI